MLMTAIEPNNSWSNAWYSMSSNGQADKVKALRSKNIDTSLKTKIVQLPLMWKWPGVVQYSDVISKETGLG